MALADGKGRQDGPGRIPPRKTADPGDGTPDMAVGPRLRAGWAHFHAPGFCVRVGTQPWGGRGI
jgi:hypothetical protein